MNFKLSNNERLKSKEQITALFTSGSKVTNFPLRLYFISVEDQPVRAKIALGVSKKSFKRAVDRNRVKRLLRECYRLNKGRYFNNIEGNFAFLILYLGDEKPNFSSLQVVMDKLFSDFKKKVG